KAVEGVFEEVSELGDHLDLTESLPAVDGNVFFSAKSLRTDTTGAVDDLVERHYLHPAIVPVLEQVPGEAPPAPRVLVARSTDEGVQVRWLGHGATSYALWHLPTPEVRDEDLADGRRLVATVRAGRGSQALVHEGADGSGWHAVTAYDNTGRGSRPSQAVAPRRWPRTVSPHGGFSDGGRGDGRLRPRGGEQQLVDAEPDEVRGDDEG